MTVVRLRFARREKKYMSNWKYIILLAAIPVISVLIAGFPYGLTANAEPEPYPVEGYIRYFNNDPYVAISVYWNDSAGDSELYWANDMAPSETEPGWQTDGLTFSGQGTAYASATLSNAQKYKNYYFKLVVGEKTNIIRAFPIDFDITSDPRYQIDYAHGNFTLGSSLCATCHSSHSALRSQILRTATYYELCMLCHSSSNTQSKYNVEEGKVYMGPENGWVNSLAGPAIGTSGHGVANETEMEIVVDGSPAIWTFSCVACHSSHSRSGDNYRLLKKNIYPSDGSGPLEVNFQAYSITRDNREEMFMVSGGSEFCATCHPDHADPANFDLTHPVTVGSSVYSVDLSIDPALGVTIPLQYNPLSSGDDKRTAVVCLTCHFAHGSPDGYGFMLRRNGYNICTVCHEM